MAISKFFDDIAKNGEYEITLTDHGEAVVFFVSCYDSAGKCVPGVGTASCSVSIFHDQWYVKPSEGDAIIHLEKAGTAPTYAPPCFLGGPIKAKIIISGLGAGLRLRAMVWCK